MLSEISFSGGFYRNHWHLGRRIAELQSHLLNNVVSRLGNLAPASEDHWSPVSRVGSRPNGTGICGHSCSFTLIMSVLYLLLDFGWYSLCLLFQGPLTMRRINICGAHSSPQSTLNTLFIIEAFKCILK